MAGLNLGLGLGFVNRSAPSSGGGGGGGGADPDVGLEFVVNGDFTAPDNWLASGASFAGGVCTFDGNDTSTISSFLARPLSDGDYLFTADDVNAWEGTLKATIGGDEVLVNSNGVKFTRVISIASAADSIITIGDPFGGGGDMPFDNVSLIKQAPNLFPDASMATTGDPINGWSFSGFTDPPADAGPGAAFGAGSGSTATDSAQLVGSNLAAFNAAVADLAVYTVEVTVSGYSSGRMNLTLKGSSPALFKFLAGDGTYSTDITTGSGGSGFVMTGDSGFPFHGTITAISVKRTP